MLVSIKRYKQTLNIFFSARNLSGIHEKRTQNHSVIYFKWRKFKAKCKKEKKKHTKIYFELLLYIAKEFYRSVPLYYSASEDPCCESQCKPGVSGVRDGPTECCCFWRKKDELLGDFLYPVLAQSWALFGNIFLYFCFHAHYICNVSYFCVVIGNLENLLGVQDLISGPAVMLTMN